MSTPIFRRIDYIRQTNGGIHRNGLNAPPGNNPYAKTFGILPQYEIARIVAQFPPLPKSEIGKKSVTSNRILRVDIMRWSGIDERAQFGRLLRGQEHGFGPKVLRKLSRVLMLIESGHLVKRDGKMVEVENPEVKPKIVFRVVFSDKGRPSIRSSDTVQTARVMPKLFADFKLPGG